MIAKLIVHDVDREHARRRMLRALDGVRDRRRRRRSLGFHQALLAHPCFVAGETCHGARRVGGARAAGRARFSPADERAPRRGRPRRRAARDRRGRRPPRRGDGARARAAVPRARAAPPRAGARRAPPAARPTRSSARCRAPCSSPVAEGDDVEAGAVICIVEAMKMENEVVAHRPASCATSRSRRGAGHDRPGDLRDRSPAGRTRRKGGLRRRNESVTFLHSRTAAPHGRSGCGRTRPVSDTGLPLASARPMDLYEYQGKQLFRQFGIPVSEGRLATTPEEARAAAEELGGQTVVKAQVLTGGRGQGRRRQARRGPGRRRGEGRARSSGSTSGATSSRRLWIEQASEIAKEYYLSVTFDRGAKQPLLHVHDAGRRRDRGGRRERPRRARAAARRPARGLPAVGRAPARLRRRASTTRRSRSRSRRSSRSSTAASSRRDAMLCEINPLIVTPDGEVKALDSKFTVDDCALYPPRRHRGVPRHERGRSARGVRAREGRHLREARRLGRHPRQRRRALDVDRRRRRRRRRQARELLRPRRRRQRRGRRRRARGDHARPAGESIFFNIFGGITRCDEVARGILEALERIEIDVPIVVRLDGTNAEEGRQILADAAHAERSTSSRRCSTRPGGGGARGMSDVWSERAEAYRDERGARDGRRPRPRRRVGEPARRDRARRRDRRRPRRAPAARGGRAGRDRATRRRGCRPTSICFAEDLPFADASFDVVVTPVARAPLRGRRRSGRARWRGSPNRVVVVDDTLPSARRRGGREAPRPDPRPQLQRARVARACFDGAGLEVERVERFDDRIELEPWLARTGCTGDDAERVRELLGRSRPTATAGRSPTHRRSRGRADVDGDHRRQRHEARRLGPDRLARAASTGCATARTARNLVAGVTPGKGGQDVEGVPVFDTVAEAVSEAGANTSMIFVPARFAPDAIYEAVDAGIKTVICITEHIPAHEMLRVYTYVRPKGVTLIGPNCPGVLSPGKANVGIIPAEVFKRRLDRARLALGHADLPDRLRGRAARARQLDASSASAATPSSARASSTSSRSSRPTPRPSTSCSSARSAATRRRRRPRTSRST